MPWFYFSMLTEVKNPSQWNLLGRSIQRQNEFLNLTCHPHFDYAKCIVNFFSDIGMGPHQFM